MDIYYRRIGAFIEQLQQLALRKRSEAFSVFWQGCDYKKTNDIPVGGWIRADGPVCWGGKEEHRWFRIRLQLEKEWIGHRVSVNFFPQDGLGEAMQAQYLVYLKGKMLCGADMFHRAAEFDYTGDITLDVYAYTGMSKREMVFWPWCAMVDEEVRSLAYDLAVPYGVMGYAEEDSGEYMQWRQRLTDAVNALSLRDPYSEEFQKSLERAREIVQGGYGMQTLLAKATFIGHTHIDLAWLWTLAQTREKVQRTFTSVLKLMREYPEFKFMSSQPQLYEFFRQEAPQELWEELKERVREGRWEADGAMWVEADCNLICGESIVRQILYGKRYFQQQFGKASRILWLPDAFGYTAALPQILKKCGIDWFVTSKISWNDTDTMPHDVFSWKGTDGSQVYAYFLTAQNKIRGQKPNIHTTYIGIPEPSQAVGTWERFHDKNISGEVINTFGYGDGGGGPTAEHMEKIRRLCKGVAGCVSAQIDTAGNFLGRLQKRIEKNSRLAVWEGELYLEYHRGTYTSQAANKKGNRRAEFLLHNLELAASLCAKTHNAPYPAKELEQLWKLVLLNQFHDILPGSGISEIYRDSAAQYAEIFESGNALLRDCWKDLAGGLIETMYEKSGGQNLFVFNPNGFAVSGEVRLPSGELVFLRDLPPMGYTILQNVSQSDASAVRLAEKTLENKFFRLCFDEHYELEEIYDKRFDRQILQSGQRGNQLAIYDDHGNYEFDAWEIKEFYTENRKVVSDVVSVSAVEDGCRKGLRIRKRYANSVFEQTIFLYDDTERIDFENDFDIRDARMIVKAEFPVDIHAGEATYDIQFGSIKRNTHKNTSWDAARFESYGHKYVDVSEGNYGVSLLNDCKYGYDIHGGVIRMTLLKTAIEPDPQADIGRHTFRYALFPHGGPCGTQTVRQAYLFNNPPVAAFTEAREKSASFVSCDTPEIVLETVKRAENGDGYIVRCYECANTRAKGILSFGFEIQSAELCDLLENKEQDLPCARNTLAVCLKPFEIYTLRIRPKGAVYENTAPDRV